MFVFLFLLFVLFVIFLWAQGASERFISGDPVQ